MAITNLNTFTAGTVASVTPMNENFETIRVAVNTIEQTVNNNRTYLDNKVVQINENIETSVKGVKTQGELFCVNSGPFNLSGKPEILDVSGTTLSFSTPFIATNSKGTVVTATSLGSISLAGYADGNYNVFIDTDKNIEILKNTVYKQPVSPNAVIGDIWLNTSKNPLEASKYTSSGWEEFLKIPIGSFSVSSGSVQNVKTNSYNQNGYNINIESGFPMPNFSKGIGKSNDVSYTAETAGWIRVHALFLGSNSTASVTVNGQTFTTLYTQFHGTTYGSGLNSFIPIPKGAVYSCSVMQSIVFYPVITN